MTWTWLDFRGQGRNRPKYVGAKSSRSTLGVEFHLLVFKAVDCMTWKYGIYEMLKIVQLKDTYQYLLKTIRTTTQTFV